MWKTCNAVATWLGGSASRLVQQLLQASDEPLVEAVGVEQPLQKVVDLVQNRRRQATQPAARLGDHLLWRLTAGASTWWFTRCHLFNC